MRKPIQEKAAAAQALYRQALEKQRAGALAEAVALYEKAVAILPSHFAILANLGVCLGLLGRHDRATPLLEKARIAKPNDPLIEGALGASYYHCGEAKKALPLLETALRRAPQNREAALFLALTLERLGRLADATALLERLAKATPPFAAALRELARLYGNARRRSEEAVAALEAWRLEPDRLEPNVRAYYALQCLADWSALPELDAGFFDRISRDDATEAYLGDPFNLLARGEDRAVERKAAERRTAWVLRAQRVGKPFRRWRERDPTQPLRIGYLSADLHDHATMHLMAGVFRAHDPARVTVHSYSYGPDAEDDARRLVRERSAVFREFREIAASEAARRIHADALDLLIDLKGHTRDARLEIAAYRPAPVQATHLGYPGTLGANFIDYAIVDEVVAPPEHAPDYTEILAYHPVCYQPNAVDAPAATLSGGRAEWGLPEQGVVFCSFNQTYKIDPTRFESWMTILRACEGSALWLLRDSETAEAALRREASARGVSAERLVFAEKVPRARHLARLRCADIALDTRLYNGHTTTTDALLAGVPVVATLGDHFAGRVAASLLCAAGLDELIASDEQAYVETAIALAAADHRARLTEQLDEAKTSAALFDPERYTRALEALYAAMVARGPKAKAGGETAGDAKAPLRLEPGAF